MQRFDVVPVKAQFTVGENIVLECLRENGDDAAGAWKLKWEVISLAEVVARGEGEWNGEDPFLIAIENDIITGVPGAYGAFVTCIDASGDEATAETAFDVVHHWREAPRYGFLSDFGPGEAGKLEDVQFLRRMHINIVQFYDWMYRHDQLLAGEEEFVDPLGRRLSHAVVRQKVSALTNAGMSPIAYAAVYASLKDYVAKHPHQVLYQNNREPHSLAGLFYIMDISVDSKWTRHITAEFRQAVAEMGFAGLHLDQYGMPKQAIRKTSHGEEVVSLNKLYPEFINHLRNEFGPEVGLIFNNVSNYPTHTTAKANQDIVYIEVWDPASRFRDLKELIKDARNASGKQVVLAAYLPGFHPEQSAPAEEAEIGAALTMATIFASGGYHLLLGEAGKVLADPYYPKYGTASARFLATLQRYYNYIVMYRDILFREDLADVSMSYTGGINTEVLFHKDDVRFSPSEEMDSVWTFVKEREGLLVLHMINLVGVDGDNWHEPKQAEPLLLESVEVRVELWQAIEGIYWASPDNDSIRSEQLQYDVVSREAGGDYVRFVVPRLKYWSTVYIQMRHGVPIALKR